MEVQAEKRRREQLRARCRGWLGALWPAPVLVGTACMLLNPSPAIAGAGFLIELAPLFSEKGHHHIPIIDREQRLVGIITQSGMVRALYRTVQPAVDGMQFASSIQVT